MDFLSDITELLKKIPLQAWLLLIGLVILGLAWQKSKLPNAWIFPVKMLIGTAGYPFLMNGPEAAQQHWNPIATLAFEGAGIALVSYVFAESIVAKIKQRFPSIQFPDNGTPPQTDKPKET